MAKQLGAKAIEALFAKIATCNKLAYISNAVGSNPANVAAITPSPGANVVTMPTGLVTTPDTVNGSYSRTVGSNVLTITPPSAAVTLPSATYTGCALYSSVTDTTDIILIDQLSANITATGGSYTPASFQYTVATTPS